MDECDVPSSTDKDEHQKGLAAKDILQAHLATVTSIVKSNPVDFYVKLVQESLVNSESFYPDDKTNKQEQAVKLYTDCMEVVKTAPSKFSKLMEVLNSYQVLDETVAKMKKEGRKAGLMDKSDVPTRSKEGAAGDDDGEKDGRSFLGKHSKGATKEPSRSEECKSKSLLDEKPSEQDLLKLVAVKIVDYHKLGVILGLGWTKTDKIEDRYKGKTDTISLKVLLTWKEEHTRTPITWRTLIQALHEIDLNDLAQNITDELEQRQNPSS